MSATASARSSTRRSRWTCSPISVPAATPCSCPPCHSEHCTGCGKCEKSCVLGRIGHSRAATQAGSGLAGPALPGGLGRAEEGWRVTDRRNEDARPARPPARRRRLARSLRPGIAAIPKRCAAWPAARQVSSRACRLAWGQAMSQMSQPRQRIGAEAVEEKGWLGAHKWLLLRRISQLSILALFLLGPLAGTLDRQGQPELQLHAGRAAAHRSLCCAAIAGRRPRAGNISA